MVEDDAVFEGQLIEFPVIAPRFQFENEAVVGAADFFDEGNTG